jgi:hypothetical protein
MIGRGNSSIAGGVQFVPANGSKFGVVVVDFLSSSANKWRLQSPTKLSNKHNHNKSNINLL